MDGQELASQVTSAAMVVYVLQWLKAADWFPWLSNRTKGLSRLASAVLAAASAIGVHAAFDSAAGVLTITGLTATGVLHGLWLWLQQFVLQQLAYDSVLNAPVKKKA